MQHREIHNQQRLSRTPGASATEERGTLNVDTSGSAINCRRQRAAGSAPKRAELPAVDLCIGYDSAACVLVHRTCSPCIPTEVWMSVWTCAPMVRKRCKRVQRTMPSKGNCPQREWTSRRCRPSIYAVRIFARQMRNCPVTSINGAVLWRRYTELTEEARLSTVCCLVLHCLHRRNQKMTPGNERTSLTQTDQRHSFSTASIHAISNAPALENH